MLSFFHAKSNDCPHFITESFFQTFNQNLSVRPHNCFIIAFRLVLILWKIWKLKSWPWTYDWNFYTSIIAVFFRKYLENVNQHKFELLLQLYNWIQSLDKSIWIWRWQWLKLVLFPIFKILSEKYAMAVFRARNLYAVHKTYMTLLNFSLFISSTCVLRHYYFFFRILELLKYFHS